MTIRLAVFDCDGTLVDGQAAVCDAMEVAFDHADLPTPARHDVRRIVGLSLPQAIRHLAPDATDSQRAMAVDAYKASFFETRRAGRLHEPLFDGIAGLLDQLTDRGWALAVATGKSDRGLITCLKAHAIHDRFVSLQTADRHPSKPNPAMLETALSEAGALPENAVMIGDTTFDIEMASAADVRAIGVDWGYHSADELLAAGAAGVASSVRELGDMLQ